MLKENSSITVTISRDFECKHFILFYFLILLDQPASWWETILMFVFVCFFVISFDLLVHSSPLGGLVYSHLLLDAGREMQEIPPPKLREANQSHSFPHEKRGSREPADLCDLFSRLQRPRRHQNSALRPLFPRQLHRSVANQRESAVSGVSPRNFPNRRLGKSAAMR